MKQRLGDLDVEREPPSMRICWMARYADVNATSRPSVESAHLRQCDLEIAHEVISILSRKTQSVSPRTFARVLKKVRFDLRQQHLRSCFLHALNERMRSRRVLRAGSAFTRGAVHEHHGDHSAQQAVANDGCEEGFGRDSVSR